MRPQCLCTCLFLVLTEGCGASQLLEDLVMRLATAQSVDGRTELLASPGSGLTFPRDADDDDDDDLSSMHRWAQKLSETPRYVAFSINAGESHHEDLALCLGKHSCPHLAGSHAESQHNHWRFLMEKTDDAVEALAEPDNAPRFDSRVYLASAAEPGGRLDIDEAYSISQEDRGLEVNLVETWDDNATSRTYHGDHLFHRRGNLGGKTFRVFLNDRPPISFLVNRTSDGTGVALGINPEILDALFGSLNASLEYEHFEHCPACTADWKMGLIDSGRVDTSALFNILAPERMERMSFSAPVTSFRMRLVSLKGNPYSNAFTSSFSCGVWAVTLATVACLITTGNLAFGFLNTSHKAVGSKDLYQMAGAVYGAFLAQGSSLDLGSLSLRMILWTTLAFGVLSFNAFSARLVSTLSVDVSVNQVRSYEDVVKLGLRLFLPRFGLVRDHFRDANDDDVKKKLWDENVEREDLRYLTDTEMIEEFVTSEDPATAAMIVSPVRLSKFIREHPEKGCLLQDVPTPIAWQVGIPFRRDFPYLGAVNHQLRKMSEAGVIERIYDSWTESHVSVRQRVCPAQDQARKDGYLEVGLQGTKYFFLLLFAGAMLAANFALLEWQRFVKANVSNLKHQSK